MQTRSNSTGPAPRAASKSGGPPPHDRSLAARLKSTAGTVAEESQEAVREGAERFANDAADLASEKLEDVSRTAKRETEAFAAVLTRAVRAGADEFAEGGYPLVAEATNRLGDMAQDLADNVSVYNTGKISAQVRQVVQQRPAITFGAIALLGFVGAMAVSRLAENKPHARPASRKRSS